MKIYLSNYFNWWLYFEKQVNLTGKKNKVLLDGTFTATFTRHHAFLRWKSPLHGESQKNPDTLILSNIHDEKFVRNCILRQHLISNCTQNVQLAFHHTFTARNIKINILFHSHNTTYHATLLLSILRFLHLSDVFPSTFFIPSGFNTS